MIKPSLTPLIFAIGLTAGMGLKTVADMRDMARLIEATERVCHLNCCATADG